MRRSRAFFVWLALAAGICGLANRIALGANSPANDAPANDVADQYTVAAGHYAAARWELAVEAFQSLLKDHPDFAKADKCRFFTGEALVQLGRYADARKQFDDYLAHDSAGAYAKQALFRAGETALMAGDNDTAGKSLADFLAKFGDDPLCAYVLMYQGELALAKGDGAAAEASLGRSLKKFSDAPAADETRFQLGRAYLIQNKLPDAEKIFRQMTTATNAALAEQAQLQLAMTELQAQQWDSAIASLETFEGRYPNSRSLVDCRLAHARALQQLGKRDDARGIFEALAADPQHGVEAASGLAQMQADAKDWPAAIKTLSDALRQATAATPPPPQAEQIRVQLATVQYQASRFDDAIATLVADDHAAQLSPDGHYLLALAYQATGKHNKALETLGDGHGKGAVVDGRVELARATSQMALGRYAEAATVLQALLASGAAADYQDRALGALAVCCVKSGDIARAKQTYAQLVARHSTGVANGSADKPAGSADGFLTATEQLASAVAATGKAPADKAWAAELYTALAADGNPPQYVVSGLSGLGWSQLDAGETEKAAATFDRLLQKFPDGPYAADAAWARGAACERLKNYDAALAAYSLIIDRLPDSKHFEDALLAAARLHAQLKQYPQAVALYERLVKERPDSARIDEARYGWAWTLCDSGQSATADEQFQKLHDDFPKSRLWADATFRLAESAAAKKPESATKLLDELLAAQPPAEIAEHALYLASQIAAAQQSWPQVDTAMQRLVKEHPDSSLRLPAMFWQAEAAYRQGRFDEAGERFALLADQVSGRNDKWLAMIPLRRAQVLAQQKHWSEAQEMAGPIETTYPDFSQQYEVDYLLGRALASQADFDGARKKYAKVLHSPTGAKTETAAMAEWMTGETYFHQENYEAALREYLRVEILYAYPRWQAAALLQAGKCQEALKRPKEAAQLYARLIKAYGNTEFTDEAQGRLKAVEAAK